MKLAIATNKARIIRTVFIMKFLLILKNIYNGNEIGEKKKKKNIPLTLQEKLYNELSNQIKSGKYKPGMI